MPKLTITLTPPAKRAGEEEQHFVLLGVAMGWTIQIGRVKKHSGLHQVLTSKALTKTVTLTCVHADKEKDRHSVFWFVSGKQKNKYTINLNGPIKGFDIDPSSSAGGVNYIEKTIAQGESLGAGHRYFWLA